MKKSTFNGRLSELQVEQAVRLALQEDLGAAGDITTNATVPADAKAKAVIASRSDGVIAGIQFAEIAFKSLDRAIRFDIKASDGTAVEKGDVVARISGSARAILSAERVALNYMGRLCGIATLTRAYVDAVAKTKAKIADTRKTTPGLRMFEKFAVRCGGGVNHRIGLYDAILIKDNHIAAAGGVARAITAARAEAPHLVKVQVEVDTLEQLREALAFDIDAVLLDNMTLAELKTAVAMVNGKAIVEASGGVTLRTVRAIAETGVDLISVGALTHSAPVLDLGLDFLEK